MRLTAWGGVDEIGGNKFLIECGGGRIFLDFGMSYDREGYFFEPPFLQAANREDLLKTRVLPPLTGCYRGGGLFAEYDPALGPTGVAGIEEPRALDAMVLSHAHMDHYGYAGLLRPDIPILASPLTGRLISMREDISEGFTTAEVSASLAMCEPGQPLEVGDLRLTPFAVDHSVPGATAWIIESEGVRVGYTGDLRMHGPAEGRAQTAAFLEALARNPVDYLLCEGTRLRPPESEDEKEVEHHGLVCEDDVAGKVGEIIEREPGLVVYDGSPADMGRMRIVCRAAIGAGRKLAVDAKLAYLLLYVNRDQPLMDGCDEIARQAYILLGRRKAGPNTTTARTIGRDGVFIETFDEGRQGHEKILLAAQRIRRGNLKGGTAEELASAIHIPDERFIWGPRREEVLANPGEWFVYTSNGPLTCLHFVTSPGCMRGTYVYGKAEPFNEEMEFSFERLKNWIELAGLKLEYAHTSGHMRAEHLKNFLREAGARRVIPIHTEAPEAFAELHPDVRRIAAGEGVALSAAG